MNTIRGRIIRLIALAWLLGLAWASGAAAQMEPPAEGAADTPAQETPPRISYEALADLLEDDQARQALIEDLRRQAATRDEPEAEPPPDAPATFAHRIAAGTQNFAEGLVAEGVQAVTALREVGTTLQQADWTEFGPATVRFGAIIIATLALFLVLRRLERPLFLRLSGWAVHTARGSALLRRATAVLGAALLDFGVIALAWLGGYLLALFAIAPAGGLETRHSLFLNAFLFIEAFKALLRMFFSARYDGLRLLRLTGEVAAYWNAWLARLSGFIGYGMLVVVPILDNQLGAELGRLAAVVIMALAFLYAVTIILQNRSVISHHLQNRAQGAELAFSRMLYSLAAKLWHLAAIAYVAALGLVTLLRPEDALPFMVQATVQTLGAIAIGVFVAIVIAQLLGRNIHIPEETRHRYPMLEARLNAFVPTTLKIMRALIGVIVAAVILDAWQLFNLGAWLASDAGIAIIGSALSVALIVAVATMLWIGLATWIESRLDAEARGSEPGPREKTLLTLFRNAAAIVIVVMAVMIALSELGVNIGPLIAGAGVLGLAIGFGAQKLVQDVITGVFIQLENAINVGDFVTAGGISGTAETLSIRSVGLRDLSGTFHLIPFSSVDSVSNFTREYAFHVGEYGIAYREDIDEAFKHLQAAFDELREDPNHAPSILDDLEVSGVTGLGDSSVNIRVRIKTTGGAQWAVGRAYNRLVKQHFDGAGIEIPFPHTTLYFGQDKDGTAPPARVQVTPPAETDAGNAETPTKEQERQPATAGDRADRDGTGQSPR